MTDLAIEKREQQIAPMMMIQQAFQVAIERGEGMQVVGVILAQLKEQREYEDKAAFNAALQRIQSKLKPIARDLENPGRGKYASARAIDDAIVELCNEENLALSFNTEDCPKPDTIRLICDANINGSGYTKRYALDVPADGSGPKGGGVMNRTQATGSAVTSGKRYIKNMIFNLRIREKDDDGNAAGGNAQIQRMTEGAQQDWVDHIKSSTTVTELQTRYLDALKAADAAGDLLSTKQFSAAQNQCFNQLKAKREGKS